jgi:hypothetical protein
MRQKSVRRSAADWAALVQGWKASDVPLKTFALHHGLKPSALSWWKWKLGTVSRSPMPDAPQLLPVEWIDDRDTARDGVGEAWELRSGTGWVLKVEGPLSERAMQRLLSFLATERT